VAGAASALRERAGGESGYPTFCHLGWRLFSRLGASGLGFPSGRTRLGGSRVETGGGMFRFGGGGRGWPRLTGWMERSIGLTAGEATCPPPVGLPTLC
jgi:hypothetical protein